MYEIHYQTDDAEKQRKSLNLDFINKKLLHTSRRSRSTSDGNRFLDIIFNSSYVYNFGLLINVGAERVECACCESKYLRSPPPPPTV